MGPEVCKSCVTRSCISSSFFTVDVCEWGVAYYNNGDGFEKKETLVPLKYLSQNLRHEVHRVLGLIVSELIELNPALTVKAPDITHPTGRILGATVVIDQFLQMVAGVHEFHPTDSFGQSGKKEHLSKMVERHFNIYSLIHNPRRARHLTLQAKECKGIQITLGSECLEYILAVLIDNAWKYSSEHTIVHVTAEQSGNGLVDISIKNTSQPIPQDVKIFERGRQRDRKSDGFGFGLYWAWILTEYYNELQAYADPPMQLIHLQEILSDEEAKQKFILKNVVCEL